MFIFVMVMYKSHSVAANGVFHVASEHAVFYVIVRHGLIAIFYLWLVP